MRKHNHLADPVALFSLLSRADSTNDSHDYRWRRWNEWCAINRIRPFPATPDDVMVLLHSQSAFWSEPLMRGYAGTIALCHQSLGYDDPTYGKVRAYLTASASALAGRREKTPIAPLRAPDALDLCTAPSSAAPHLLRSTDRQRLALLAIRQHGVDVAQLAGAQIAFTDGSVRLLLTDGSDLIIDEMATDAIAAARRLSDAGITHLRSARLIESALQNTAARAGIEPDRIGHIVEWSDDEFDWFFDWTDITFVTDLRDRTLVVVGIALARRGAELCRFNIEDFTEDRSSDRGWNVKIWGSKGDRSFNGLDHHLGHSHDTDGLWCPACSLGVWLHVLRTRWGLTTGPLFPLSPIDHHHVPADRLTTERIRKIVKKVWAHGGGDPLIRIGSRSLRIGGATSAHESGFTAQEVADLILLHQTLESTPRYIRISDDAPIFHLDL